MPGDLELKSYEFRREREASWRKLDALVTRAEKSGVTSLSTEELAQLPMLYRASLSSLSVARSISLDRNLLEYLESLCGRAYFCVYGTKRHIRETLADFFRVRLPRTIRALYPHLLLATLFFFLGGAAAFVLTWNDPDLFYTFVSEEMAQGRDPGSTTKELRDVLFSSGDDTTEGRGFFASMLITHNARVGILCFALGFAAGVPVFLMLIFNGFILGAFASLYAGRGLSLEFWGWILPHGVTEILALLLCAAAGLTLAQGLVFPGRLTRLQNLARHGRRAAMLMVGTILMFFVAGLIEGIFRQTVHSTAVRYAVVVSTAGLWIWYLTCAGQEDAS